MHCSNCGAEIKEGCKFCTVCGTPQVIGESIDEQTPIQQQQEEQGEKLKDDTKGRKFINKKRWIICIVITVVLILAFGGVISARFIKAEKVKDNINLGNKYLQEGKYEEAILAFEKTIQIDPKNVEARVELAKTYINLKKYDKAEVVLKEAMAIDVKNLKPKEELIKLYILQGKEFITAQKYQEGKDYFNKAIDIDKNRVDTYLVISGYYEESENTWYDAVAILTKGYTETKNQDIKKKLDELKKKIPGNTSSNIINGGYVARQGEWLYYSNYSQKFNLFKIKVDGSNKTRLNNEESKDINVIDDWIYYAAPDGIYKINTDGSNRTKIKEANSYKKVAINLMDNNSINLDGRSYKDLINNSKFSIFTLNVVNNKLYYTVDLGLMSVMDPSGIIVSCSIDGTEEKVLCTFNDKVNSSQGKKGVNPSGCMVCGDWVYYCNIYDEISQPLFRVKIDGTENSWFNEATIMGMAASDNYIYYINYNIYDMSQSGLYKSSQDLKEKVKFDVDDIANVNAINVFEDYIYYSYGNDLYRMKKDGSNKIRLCHADNCPNIYWINVVQDWIYFGSDFEYGGQYAFRVKIDGTDLKQVD